jgi:hypothetical protein
MRFFLISFLITTFSLPAFSQVIKGGVVSEDGAYVFVKPNFDAEVVVTLPPGGVYYISKDLVNGIFHKIKVKKGVMGYVSTSDIKPLSKKDQKAVQVEEVARKKAEAKRASDAKARKESGEKNPQEPSKQKSFEYQRYWGPQIATVDFKEDTMGEKRHDNLTFFGVKFSGANVLIGGATQTDVNLMIAPSAPSYYEGATKRSATGFVFLANFLMETYWPQSPTWMNYFGFGPTFRYSLFDVTINDPTTNKDVGFSLEDMTAGAVFHAGMAFRIGSMALRVEAQYYWETEAYFGFSLAPQFSF